MKLLVIVCVALLAGMASAATPSNLEDGTECLICEFLTQDFDKYLQSPNTEKTIVGYLEDVCHLVPSKVQSQCKSFIESEGDAIVGWIANELSPQEVCDSILNLGCDASDLISTSTYPTEVSDVSGAECDVCMDVIGALKQTLENPNTINDIVEEVTTICNGMGALKSICASLMKTWAPEVISWLDNKIDPTTVCDYIKACSADLVDANRPLLGAKKCTFGPSYWCSSMDNANECGAMEFCMKMWAKEQADIDQNEQVILS